MRNETRRAQIYFLIIIAFILLLCMLSGCQPIKEEDRTYATIVLGPIFVLIMGCVAWYTFWVLLFSPTARERRKTKAEPPTRWYTEEQVKELQIEFAEEIFKQLKFTLAHRIPVKEYLENTLKEWNEKKKSK